VHSILHRGQVDSKPRYKKAGMKKLSGTRTASKNFERRTEHVRRRRPAGRQELRKQGNTYADSSRANRRRGGKKSAEEKKIVRRP